MSRAILLVAYFYPPCRDTGALRPASMAKWLRRLGHRVIVLTTSAYGVGGDEEAVRTADAQRWRARLHGRDRIDALYDSDTYAGRPHPLSRLIVPEPLALAWAPFARHRALRLHRERDFDCVITTSPPESAHGVGMALARRGVPWVADVRDAWTFEPLRPEFPTAAQRRLDRAARAPLARRRRRGGVRLGARRRGPARAGDRRAAADPQRLGPRAGGHGRPHADRPARPGPDVPGLHRALRQLRARPAPAHRCAGAARPRRARGGGAGSSSWSPAR